MCYTIWDIVQAQTNPKQTNSNAPQTLDAIYLHPAQNILGGHEVVDMASGRVITHGCVTEIPISNVIIEAVEKGIQTRLQKKVLNLHIALESLLR